MKTETILKIVRNNDFLKEIVGQQNPKRQVKSVLISAHNIIIIGPPGIGKTTLAKSIAGMLPEIEVNDCEYNCDSKSPMCPSCLSKLHSKNKEKIKTKKISGKDRFVRIQGSPDLTAEDLLGDIDPIKAMKFGPLSIEAFTPGKIFKANNGVLFFDELNRAPQKLQNALLQVLEEGKATLGSYSVDLPANFIFIGTMNPEDESTEKLSDVLLDRFDIVHMDYPETQEFEEQIVRQKEIPDVEFPSILFSNMIKFIRNFRESDKLAKAPSVRASIALYQRAASNAILDSKQKVNFGHIEEALVSVLSHRIELKPSVKYLQDPIDLVKEHFAKFCEENKIEMSDCA